MATTRAGGCAPAKSVAMTNLPGGADLGLRTPSLHRPNHWPPGERGVIEQDSISTGGPHQWRSPQGGLRGRRRPANFHGGIDRFAEQLDCGAWGGRRRRRSAGRSSVTSTTGGGSASPSTRRRSSPEVLDHLGADPIRVWFGGPSWLRWKPGPGSCGPGGRRSSPRSPTPHHALRAQRAALAHRCARARSPRPATTQCRCRRGPLGGLLQAADPGPELQLHTRHSLDFVQYRCQGRPLALARTMHGGDRC